MGELEGNLGGFREVVRQSWILVPEQQGARGRIEGYENEEEALRENEVQGINDLFQPKDRDKIMQRSESL